jgi:type I restriction enzyme S subunit
VDFEPVNAKRDGRKPVGMDDATAALFPEHFQETEMGPVPAGWEVRRLPLAIEVNPRRVLQQGTLAPYLDMQNMPTASALPEDWSYREVASGMRFKNHDTLVARITPCLENGKTAYVDFLEENQVGWGSTEYIVLSPKVPLPSSYDYFLSRTDDFRSFAIANMTGSSGRQRVPASCLDNYYVAVPDAPIAADFGRLADRYLADIRAKLNQNRSLSRLRDTLLPQFLSGQLRVGQAENLVAETV